MEYTQLLNASISFNSGTIFTGSALKVNIKMPRTRMDEMFALAEEHDGLLIS